MTRVPCHGPCSHVMHGYVIADVAVVVLTGTPGYDVT